MVLQFLCFHYSDYSQATVICTKKELNDYFCSNTQFFLLLHQQRGITQRFNRSGQNCSARSYFVTKNMILNIPDFRIPDF